MIKKIGSLVVVLVFIALAVPANASKEKDFLGKKAPDFALEDIKTGKKVRLSSFQGSKIVVINFWKSK